MSDRFQLCWYGWRAWRRFCFERFTNSLRFVYRWRVALGPLDVRLWRRREDALAMMAAKSSDGGNDE